MPAVTSRKSNQSHSEWDATPKNQLWVMIQHRAESWGQGGGVAMKKVTRSQPAEIYATIMPPKHSPLCLSQIIASVQMLLSYIT